MKDLFTLYLITAFLFLACGGKTEKKTLEIESITEDLGKDSINTKPSERPPTTESDLLVTLPIRHFPIIDSTNFENFEKTGIPDKGYLKRINFNTEHIETKNFRLNYKIPFSENFTSVVVTYQSGDHELFTYLITVNKENKVIDRLEVAYDETAESAFMKTSTIEKDKIVLTKINWMSEEPIYETQTYIWQADGKFKMVQSDTK